MKKKSSVTNRKEKEIEKAALYYKNITTARNGLEHLKHLERIRTSRTQKTKKLKTS